VFTARPKPLICPEDLISPEDLMGQMDEHRQRGRPRGPPRGADGLRAADPVRRSRRGDARPARRREAEPLGHEAPRHPAGQPRVDRRPSRRHGVPCAFAIRAPRGVEALRSLGCRGTSGLPGLEALDLGPEGVQGPDPLGGGREGDHGADDSVLLGAPQGGVRELVRGGRKREGPARRRAMLGPWPRTSSARRSRAAARAP
jgi:hypothetical protein